MTAQSPRDGYDISALAHEDVAAPPPCLCAHPVEDHEHGTRQANRATTGGVVREANRCQRPGCGCLRYRPDITQEAP